MSEDFIRYESGKKKVREIDPRVAMQFAQLLAYVKEEGLSFELTSKTSLKIGERKPERLSEIGEDHVKHMLIQDSRRIAQSLRKSFDIKENEKAEVNGFLAEFQDEKEDSAQLVRKIRESS